jgi:hypothetical protein
MYEHQWGTALKLERRLSMTRHTSARWFRIALLALLMIWMVPSAASSQEQKGFAKVGGYAGVTFAPKFTFDGDTFDGMTFYREVGGDEILILPKLDEQLLIKGILGYRGNWAAVEFSYERTKHDATFAEGTGETIHQSINLDGRFFFLSKGPIQPYVLAGAGLPWLTVKDGSFLEDEPEAGLDDGSFKGWVFNTEVGVTVYPHRQIGIAVGYSYRWFWFDRATGITDKLYHLRPRFKENSNGLVITGLVTF